MTEITPPVACTLDSAETHQRRDAIRALGRDGLQAVERGEQHVTLRFRPDPAIRERVAGIVAAESRCCAFLDFTLAATDDATMLTITAPEGAEPAVHVLADLFSAVSAVRRS
jgi:MerR family copper efflux transcriptional regulator